MIQVTIGVLRRWKKALRIAKVLFEDQGYRTGYLEEIESYIEDKGGENV